ncbi:MAG TPA: M28 family peptidase [Chloroflexi bacterium]|nr:M28 family peptidase [Chloroflexota bacterium]HPO57636.1 M28 family peptidase [Anaerolineaceae bacterium]
MGIPAEESIRSHLQFLAGTTGPRPTGSPAYRQAAEYIRRTFSDAGLQIQDIRFPCIDWRHRATRLEIGSSAFTAAANPFSPACDVPGTLLPLCTPAELEAAEIGGKILLFYGDLSNEPLIPLNCEVYNTERDQRINRLLVERKPAAVLSANLNWPAADARIEDADMPIPSATVDAETALALLDHAGEEAHLVILAERLPSEAITLVGSRPGPDRRKLVLMAHYDTKVNTPGAIDNAAGAAALLCLAGRLAERPPAIGLEFIAFGDEEYYAYSDGMYVKQFGEQFADIVLAINFDAVGQRLGTDTLALMGASPELQSVIDGILRRYPQMLWTDPWPQSNHSTFAFRGVPSLALISRGSNRLHHQPQDSLRWVSPEKIAAVVALIEEIIAAVQNCDPAWSREKAE